MASIKKRADGVWRARYRDDAGKEHARHFKRKTDAERWLDEVTASRVTGTYVDPKAGTVTFTTYFEEWKKAQIWALGTVEAADRAVVGIPFADVPLSKLSRDHFQAWVNEMRGRGLKASTIRTRYNYVHMAMRAAVGTRIQRDPSKIASRKRDDGGVRLPALPKASSETMKIPEPAQVAKILAGADAHFEAFVAVCAFAGLRLGEAAALRVEDVDFLKRRIRVRRQVQGENVAATRICEPKAGSVREVPVPEALTVLLARHVEEIGVRGEEGYLFCSGKDLFNRNSAGAMYRKAAKAAGVEGFTLHSLRHFFASSLIQAGCDVVTVQRAMGHSQPSITLNTYSHLWRDGEDRIRAASTDVMAEVLAAPADSVRTEAR